MQTVSLKNAVFSLFRKVQSNISFFKKGGAAIADQGLFAGSNFLINIILARFMLPEEYGAFATAYAIFLLMGSVYTAVIIEPMLVFGSGKYAERWKRYLGVMLYAHWWLSIILSVILISVAYVFQQQGSTIMGAAMLGLCIAQPLILMNWTLRRAFYVNSQPQLAASGGAVYLVLMLAGTFGVSWLGILSSFTALIVIAIASLVTSVWFMFLLNPIQLSKLDDDMSLIQVFKDHMNYGKWSAPTMILTWIPSNIYYTVLPLVVGLAGSGALKASMNLIMPILHTNTAISVLLAPSFVRALKFGGKARLQQRTNFGLLVFSVTCGIYWCILMLYGRQFIDFIGNGQYTDTVNFGILFLMGLIPLTNGISEIISGSLRAIGKLNYIFWSHVVSGIVTLVVGISLLFVWGLTGAYIGLFLASAVAAFGAYILYQRGLRDLKREDIDELHSFDSTVAEEAAAQRAEVNQDNTVSDMMNSNDAVSQLNILLVDYDTAPKQTDSGWTVLEDLIKENNLWVILGKSQREEIEVYAQEHTLPSSLNFIFFDLPFAKLLKSISENLYNHLWQISVSFLVKYLKTNHQIDEVRKSQTNIVAEFNPARS